MMERRGGRVRCLIPRHCHAVSHYNSECAHLLPSVISFTSNKKYLIHLLGLIQTVEKLQKKCIIKFGETAIRIICNHEEGGVQVWSYVTLLTPSFSLFLDGNTGRSVWMPFSQSIASSLTLTMRSRSTCRPRHYLPRCAPHPRNTLELTKSS